MADPDQTQDQPPAETPKAPAKKGGAMPLLRAHAAWVDHVGLGIRVEKGETLDWSDERVQRLFRMCLNWQAFAVEFVELPAGKVAAAAIIAADEKQISDLKDQIASLTARLENAKDDATKAIAENQAALQQQFAEAQALADERAKQIVELQDKLQAAVGGDAAAAAEIPKA